MSEAHFLAIDLGASGGRVMRGAWNGERFDLLEVHRFPNGPVRVLGALHWDVLRIWDELEEGLRKHAADVDASLHGIAVDTWGVDFALLDRHGSLIANPHHYRDGRTDGVMERVFERTPLERIYRTTGIQPMQINTLIQLASMAYDGDPRLETASTLLFMPDLFHYWLSGRRVNEYTIASTSQMLDARSRAWDQTLVDDVGIPGSILGDVVMPGTLIGEVLPDVVEDAGLDDAPPVIAVGSHDTASAVAAIPELDARSMYISSGTWSLVGVETTTPVTAEAALDARLTNDGGVDGTIRLLTNVAGLWLLQESRRHWRRDGREFAWDELLSLAEGAAPFRSFVNPDAETFLGPGEMPAAIRAYCRRTGQPEPEGPAEVTRCCLESLALKYRSVVDDLERVTGRRLDTIRIVGGGSRNALLNQFTADACRRPVAAGPVEATSLGNVMTQAIARGYLSSVEEGRQAVARSVERRFYEPRDADAWENAYERFQALSEATSGG